eukprot:1340552-Amorphochlora_amoeboformis.AAC.2
MRGRRAFARASLRPPWRPSLEPMTLHSIRTMSTQTLKKRNSPAKVMETLRREEMIKVKAGRRWPEFAVGDKILLKVVRSKSKPVPEFVRGIVMRIRRPNSVTARFQLHTHVEGDILTYEFPLYSPKIESIKVLARVYPPMKRRTFYNPRKWGVQQINLWLGDQVKARKARRLAGIKDSDVE